MKKIVKILGVISIMLLCLQSMPVDAATTKTVYTNKKTYTINSKKVTVNGKTAKMKGNKVFLKKGKNNIVVKTAKKTKKITVIYDTTKPYVLVRNIKAKKFDELLENGDEFKTSILIKAKDNYKIKNMFVDGVRYDDVATITGDGKHIVRILDKAGNIKTVKFTINKEKEESEENIASFYYEKGSETIMLEDGQKIVGTAFVPKAINDNGKELSVKVKSVNNGTVTPLSNNYIGKTGEYCLVAEDNGSILKSISITVSQEEKMIILPKITDCVESKYSFTPDALPEISEITTKSAINSTEFNSNFEYYLRDGYIHITKYNGSAQDISVPNELVQDNIVYKVTIDGTPFSMNQNLKSIQLFCDMRYIDCKEFFKGCENLKEVSLNSDLPYDVTEMFYDCKRLQHVKGWNTFSENILVANKTFAFCSSFRGDKDGSIYLNEDILEKSYIFYQTPYEG